MWKQSEEINRELALCVCVCVKPKMNSLLCWRANAGVQCSSCSSASHAQSKLNPIVSFLSFIFLCSLDVVFTAISTGAVNWFSIYFVFSRVYSVAHRLFLSFFSIVCFFLVFLNLFALVYEHFFWFQIWKSFFSFSLFLDYSVNRFYGVDQNYILNYVSQCYSFFCCYCSFL